MWQKIYMGKDLDKKVVQLRMKIFGEILPDMGKKSVHVVLNSTISTWYGIEIGIGIG